jgi:flavodoxin I
VEKRLWLCIEMKSLVIFYGSSTGNTELAAKDIAAALKRKADVDAEVIDIGRRMEPSRLAEFDNYIVGCPTWDIGELQSDWDRLFGKLDDLRLDGKTIALFGCGDVVGYPTTYQDALGILGKDFRERGATLVGLWPTEGHDFDDSVGVEGDYFLGLPLDYDNEADRSDADIELWVEQIIGEFGLE